MNSNDTRDKITTVYRVNVNKIACIKAVREVVPALTLKEAMDAVEAIFFNSECLQVMAGELRLECERFRGLSFDEFVRLIDR